MTKIRIRCTHCGAMMESPLTQGMHFPKPDMGHIRPKSLPETPDVECQAPDLVFHHLEIDMEQVQRQMQQRAQTQRIVRPDFLPPPEFN